MAKKLFITDSKRQLKIWAGSSKTRSTKATVLWWKETPSLGLKAPSLEGPFKSLDDYPLAQIMQGEELGLHWAKEFVNALTKKKEWKEVLNYEGVSLAVPLIHFLYHEVFSGISRNWVFMEEIIKSETPSHIHLHLNDRVLALTLLAYLSKANLSYSRSRTSGIVSFLEPLLQLIITTGKALVRGAIGFLNAFNFTLSATVTSISKKKSQKNLPGANSLLFYYANKRSIDFASGFMSILQEKGWKIVLIPVSETPLIINNMPYSTLLPYLSLSAIMRILKKYLASLFLPIPDRYGNLPPGLFPEIAYIVKKDSLYVLFRWTELLLSTISIEGKRGIFTTDKIFFLGRLLAEIGNSRNIPSFLMSLGMSGNFPWFEEFQFSKIFLFSPYEKEMLENRGNNSDSLVVTGNPSSDKIATGCPSKEKIRTTLDLPIKEDKKVILFISQQTSRIVSMRVREESIWLLIKVLKNIKFDHLLLVKLHPLENDDLCERILSAELGNKNFIIFKEYDTYALVQAADIVITLLSTVSIEAAAMGKRVIQINLTGISRYTPWAKEGITVEVSNAKSLQESIEKLSILPSQLPPGVERFLCKMDGKASLRIANCIEETVFANTFAGTFKKTI